MTAQQRAIADERYQKMVDMMEALPPEAKEYRFAIYPAKRRSGTKASFEAFGKVLFNEYKDQNFSDKGTFTAWLFEKFGPGRYFIEPQDEHGVRLQKLGTYTLTAGSEDDMDDDDFDDQPRGRGWSRNRSRRDDDFEDEDPREARANVADLLSASSRANSAQVATVAKESSSMLSMMMYTQQASAESRAAEERRREDVRAEERRRDEQRAEDRRREAETERKEREEREERRRDEMRERERREEDRRRDDQRLMIEQSNKRTEILVAAATSLGPVLMKAFEKKDSPLEAAILTKMNEKRETDPLTIMLLKSTLDKDSNQSASSQMIQQMGEMSKISAQMTADQMRAALSMSNEINATMMKKAMEMMSSSPQGATPEGKSFIENMMAAIGSAADIVKTLVPPAPPQMQQQQRLPHRAAPTADGAAPVNGTVVATATGAPAAPTAETTATEEWAKMTPEQQQAELAKSPRGTLGALAAMQVIQQQRWKTQDEYQQLMQYLITEMPLHLRVAVLDGDQGSVIGICKPVLDQNTDLKVWADKPEVLIWISQFVSALPPSIVAVHGPADAQRAQLQAEIAAAAAAAQPGAVAVAPTVDATPPATGEAAPAPVAPVAENAPIPGPGSVPTDVLPDGPQVPLPESSGPTSHLDDRDAP